MPDSQGSFTANEKTQILAWAQHVAPNGFMCPITGHLDNKWSLNDLAVTPMKIDKDSNYVLGPGPMPLQFIFMNSKGCMLYFSVAIAGIKLDMVSG